MKKKIFCSVLVLCLFTTTCTAFAAEPPVATEMPIATTTDFNHLPVLVDRINDAEMYADFVFAEDADLLEVYFPRILNCDAALIRCGGETMLIDCASAKQASRVVHLLQQLGVNELDCVVNTHPHYDHIQGLEILAQSIKIKELKICFNETYNAHMKTAMAVAEAAGIPVTHYADGDVLTVGGATIDVWLKGDAKWSLNEQSAQMKLQFGDRTMLFTADMMLKTQQRLVEVIPSEQLDIDILKYPHHGLNKLQDFFFDAITPLFSVITNNNVTAEKSRRYLLTKHSSFALTIPGYVSCITDGTTWVVDRLAEADPALDAGEVIDLPQEE